MPPFTTEDQALASELYQAVPAGEARQLLDYFIDHPDQQTTAGEIQTALGFPAHRHVAAAAYTIGQLAVAHGRTRPWREAQAGYTMPADLAALFATARAA